MERKNTVHMKREEIQRKINKGSQSTRENSCALSFLTASVKPSSWPALSHRRNGMRVNRSMRQSVERSVAVTSSSCTADFSHSAAITWSFIRPGEGRQGWSGVQGCILRGHVGED